MKRGLSLLLVVLLVFSLNFVFAQDPNVDLDKDGYNSLVDCDDSNFRIHPGAIEIINGIDDDCDAVVDEVNQNAVGDGNDEGEESVEVSEKDVKEFLDQGGINSGTFHKFDLFFDNLFLDHDSYSEERAAEIITLIKEGRYDEVEKLLRLYEESADKLKEGVSPEQQEKIEKRSDVIQVAINEVINDIPEEHKSTFDNIVERENNIKIAAELAAVVSESCIKLSKLDPRKFFEVCKADERAPEWKKKLVQDLTGEQEEELGNFEDILKNCMKISNDITLGNIESCECDELSGENANLCFQIVESEDACSAGIVGQCGKSDHLIYKFISDLPEDLRIVAERFGGDQINFKEEARIEIETNAPELCKSDLLTALKKGELKSPRDGERICRKIMMKEYGDAGCIEEGLSPGECASKMSGEFERRDYNNFEDCEEYNSNEEILVCYRRNSKRADDRHNFYEERRELREGIRRDGRGWPPECQHLGNFNNEEERGRLEIECRRILQDNHEQRFRATQESQLQCENRCYNEGKDWDFSNGVCSCNGNDLNKYKYPYPNQRPPGEGCENKFCQEGYRCEYGECVLGLDRPYQNQKSYCLPERKPDCGPGSYPRCNEGKQFWECGPSDKPYPYDQPPTGITCGSGSHFDSATYRQIGKGCVPNGCTYGVNPSTGQCASGSGGGSGSCSENTKSSCITISGCAWNDGPDGYIGCYSSGYVNSQNTACNNNKICDYGESSTSCPIDCGGYSGGGSCYGKTQNQCASPCVWYSDSSHLTSRGESSHCDDTAHATSSQPGITGSGTCSGSPSFSCPTGTLQCINNAWGCSDGNSKSYNSGTQCPSGQYWNGNVCANYDSSSCPTGQKWENGACVNDPAQECNKYGGSWDGSKCTYPSATTSSGSTSGTTSVSCGPGYHVENGGCVIDSSTSGTTGAAITGKSVYDNPFLKYYFGR